ncbi:MAG: hypothetical protein VXB01_06670 [Opitutae bacterium]
MADLATIKDCAYYLIMALDKTSSPQDVLEGFEQALDDYECFIVQPRGIEDRERVFKA